MRKIGTGQGSSSIARCMRKLQSTAIEGEAWRAYFDDDRYENRDLLLQRCAIILKNSEDHEVKKDHGQVQANAADTERRECYRCGRVGHLLKDCRVKEDRKCAKCGKKHLTSKHDEWQKYADRNAYKEDENNWKGKTKTKTKTKR